MQNKSIKLFTAGIALSLSVTAINALADGVSVTLNGSSLSFDVPPQIINDRTMVPLRAIFEALGAEVKWDEPTRTVTSTKDDTTVKLTVDDTTMHVNDSAITLDTPAQIVDDRTLVPVRAISEAFGADVKWDGAAQTVIIESNAASVSPTPTAAEPTPTAAPAASSDKVKNYAGTILTDFGELTGRASTTGTSDIEKGASVTHRYEYTTDTVNERESDIEKYISYLTENGWTAEAGNSAEKQILRNGKSTVEISTADAKASSKYYLNILDTVTVKNTYENTDVLDFGAVCGAAVSSTEDGGYWYTFESSEKAAAAVDHYLLGLSRYLWVDYVNHGADGIVYKLNKKADNLGIYNTARNTENSEDTAYIRYDGNRVFIRPSVFFENTQLANYKYFTSAGNIVDTNSAKYQRDDFELYMKFVSDTSYESRVNKIDNGSTANALKKPHLNYWENITGKNKNEWIDIYHSFTSSADAEALVTVNPFTKITTAVDAEKKSELLALISEAEAELDRLKQLTDISSMPTEAVRAADLTFDLMCGVEPYEDLAGSMPSLKSCWNAVYTICESGNTEKLSYARTQFDLVAKELKKSLS